MKYRWDKWIFGVILVCVGNLSAVAAEKVTLFAAVSLTNALQDIAKQYQVEKQIEVVVSYASSSTLAQQIAKGITADLFISADQQSMDYLAEKQAIVSVSRYTLLGNELVLIAPTDSNIYNVAINKETDWKNLLDGGRLALGDPDHVPAGVYAKQALEYWGAWSTLAADIIAASDVRRALALVERSKAPLGIVYGSDAVSSDKVRVVGVFPDQSHNPIEYPMAIIRGHENPQVSAFYDYLKSPSAITIFRNNGFSYINHLE